MIRNILNNKTAMLLASVAAIGMAGSASAWTDIKNGTPNTVSVAYAHSSTSGILCGYSTCGGQWQSQGWWNIAPGGTARVNGHSYGNAYEHLFAMDNFGHRWQGTTSATVHWIDWNNAYSMCGDPTPSNTASFIVIHSTRCCGGSCPDNHTVTLTL